MYLLDDFQLSCPSLSAKSLFKHFLSNPLPDLKQFDKELLPLGAGDLEDTLVLQGCPKLLLTVPWTCPGTSPPAASTSWGKGGWASLDRPHSQNPRGLFGHIHPEKGFSQLWNLGNSSWLPRVISCFSAALSRFQWFLTSPPCDVSSPTGPGALFAWEGQQQNKYLPFLCLIQGFIRIKVLFYDQNLYLSLFFSRSLYSGTISFFDFQLVSMPFCQPPPLPPKTLPGSKAMS